MKVAWINPFIESVYSLCSTMLRCTVERGNPGLATADQGGDITALIGLSGPARGTVALSFPQQTAHAMVGRLLQLDEREIAANVADGVAELVNIVAGSAKARITQGGSMGTIDLGLPTIIRGGDAVVDYPRKATWLSVPFASDLGPFNLRVTFEQEPKKGTIE